MGAFNVLLLMDEEAATSISRANLIKKAGDAAGFKVAVEILPAPGCDRESFLLERLERLRPQLLLLDFHSDSSAADVTLSVRRKHARREPLLAIVDGGKPDQLSRVADLGVEDFVIAPVRMEDLFARMIRLRQQALADTEMKRTLRERVGLKQLIGTSKRLMEEIDKIPKIASCDLSVLIIGETGTGKELVARAIHHLSARNGRPFVPVNCGALPAELLENELFGHEKGAFTGASGASEGLIQESNGGSIFLDEIDALAFPAQVKILRLLQEKEYRRLGSSKTQKADARIIAASNADFKEATSQGRFRRDLFYRLSMITVTLPPLRERSEDISLLANHFLANYSRDLGKTPRQLSRDAVRKLQGYGWPGNVRELENIIGRAVVLSERALIEAEEIQVPELKATPEEMSFKALKARVVEDFEQRYLRDLLQTHQGNISRAANAAKKNRRAFWHLLQKHQINSDSFRSRSTV